MDAVLTNHITDILYFSNKDRYKFFLGSISLKQIDQELITNATETDNTRGRYEKYTDQQRFQIGKYAVENGTAASVRKYRPYFPKINESTIREIKRKYEVQVRH